MCSYWIKLRCINCLIHFNNAVNLSDEPKAGKETDGPGQQEKQENHDERVAKVQERRWCVVDLQLRSEVMTAVDEQVDGCEATREETPPPPVIICGKLRIIDKENNRLFA